MRWHWQPLRRALSGILLVSYTAGCSSWHVAGPTPQEYVQAHNPESLRITRLDSSQVVVKAPRVQGDTLLGTVGGGLRLTDTLRTLAIPLSDVRVVEVRKSDAGMVLAFVGVAMLVGAVVFEASGGVMGD